MLVTLSVKAARPPFGASPNSCACLKHPLVSPPPLAKATTSAPDPCACRRKDEKSAVLIGWRTDPTTLPPAASTAAVQLASRSLPKAESAVTKNQLLPPRSV